MADPSAASSAFESATAAATSMEPSGPMTSAPAPSGSGGGASGSTMPNAGSKAEWNFLGLGLGAMIAAVGVVVGGGAVLM